MRALVAPVALILALAACGSGTPTTTGGNPMCPTGGPTAPPPTDKPIIEIPSGDPPATLQIRDITTGSGPEAGAGCTVTVHYVGVAWSTRSEFDASYGGAPATFPLDGVIRGWGEGIPGMRVGGRRELTIPPALGYGARGAPPDIGPNETLIFVIDLLGVS